MTMFHRAIAIVLLLAAATTPLGAQTDRDLYVAALAHERTVRAALVAPDASTTVLTDVRAVAGEYRAIVKQFPSSGYSDNALWQAGRLLLDGFTRFGEMQDKDTGLRLLRSLTTMYPTSKLVRQVPDQIAGFVDGTASPAAAPAARLATITDIHRTVFRDAVRVTIAMDTEVSFHEERLSNPERVFFDFPATRVVTPLLDRTLRFDGDADVVHQIRLGRQPNNTTRVVLDATGVSVCGVYPLYDPYRLVIDCVRTSIDEVPLLVSRTLRGDPLRRLAAVAPRSTALIADALGATPQLGSITDVASSMERSPAPARNMGGTFSISRQLGLGVSRIVIDPGHGGHDPGAQGMGFNEAELVLDIAQRLEVLLEKIPGTEVILTRRTDDFVPLQERTAFANREGADLFLSIHANASENAAARGIETYYLNFANNLSAAAVAARENAASGQAMGALPDFVKAIALNNKLAESRDFATQVQRSMIDRLRTTNKTVKDLGVKQAPFVVLIGAAMPSVLAEISFVTNAQEAKLLRGTAYRQRIAEALFNAVRRYQSSLKVTTVARAPSTSDLQATPRAAPPAPAALR